MSTPDSTPQPERPTVQMPSVASAQPVATATGTTPMQNAATQPLPQIPAQQFSQSVEDVYQAVKNTLMHSQSFGLNMADDVAKTASFVSCNAGTPYKVQVVPGAQSGSVVQFVPQGQPTPSLHMESMVFFGELNRELMMQQMNAARQQPTQQTWNAQPTNGGASTPKKPAPWVLYLAIGALAVSVIALILLIVLTPKTGAWLVWVLGIASLALSGFSLYASLMLDKNLVNRIFSGVAVGISVLAIVFGCVNMPKAMTTTVAKTPSSSSSSPAASSESSSSSGESSNTGDEQSNERQNGDSQNQGSVAAGLDEIASSIEKDIQSSSDSITAKQQETETKLGDTFDSYKANESALTDWYAFVDSESKALYGKVADSSVKYMQTLSQKASADKYLDADALLDDFYKTVYEDGFETYYDDIYETSYEDMYDKYYGGVLEDKPENMEYSEYSDLRSNAYKAWSDSKSDFYSEWSDMKSAVYTLYSDVNSDVWKDNYDFSKAIERFQKKTAQFTAQ